MQFAYADSFYKNIENLNKTQKERLLKAFRKFESYWEIGKIPQGAGLTHLRGNFYEFRIDIHNRVLFQRSGDTIYYLLYGSHDEIRHFLNRI